MLLKSGRNALSYACEYGSFDIIKFLIDSGSDVHNRDKVWTILILWWYWWYPIYEIGCRDTLDAFFGSDERGEGNIS